jgi:hypothetical protein
MDLDTWRDFAVTEPAVHFDDDTQYAREEAPSTRPRRRPVLEVFMRRLAAVALMRQRPERAAEMAP